MITIIRRYIAVQWLRSFFGSFGLLLILLTVANLISGLLRSNIPASDVLGNYLIDLPAVFIRITPISCMIASLFSLNKMVNRNELTAIFAAGFSRINYLSTVFTIATVVAFVLFLIGGYIQPFAKQYRDVLVKHSQEKFRNLKKRGIRYSTLRSGKIWFKSKDYYFSFAAYDRSKKILVDIDLYFYDKEYRLQQKVTATKAEHLIDNTWIFHSGINYSSLNGRVFPESKQFQRMSFILNEIPSDFDKIEADTSILYPVELWNYIRKIENSGINAAVYLVQFWRVFSEPLICIFFALAATIGVFNPNRRSSSFSKNIIAVFVFVVTYWLINSYMIELGKNSKLPAFLSCFSFIFILILVEILLFYKNRQLRN